MGFRIKPYKSCDMCGYTYDMVVYLGKDRTRVRRYDRNKKLKHSTEKEEGHGCKLHMDILFLSPDIFNDLTKMKLNCCGAVRHKRNECCRVLLAAYFLLVSHLTYASALKKEAVHSSQTSVDIYQTTQHYIKMTVLFIGSVCCLNLAWLTYRP
jgi:hypothetical protein